MARFNRHRSSYRLTRYLGKQEVVFGQRHLAVYDYFVAGAERDRAFMSSQVKRRDGNLTKILDTESRHVDMVGAEIWSCATNALTEILYFVVSIVEVKHEGVVASFGIAQHHLSV